MPKHKDLTGMIIHHWKVNEYLGNSKYRCTCLLCNTEHDVFGYKMTGGRSKCCAKCAAKLNGENQRVKLEGTYVNDWYVEKYLGDGKYLCRCKCNNTSEIEAYQLLNNKTHRCKECNNKVISDKLREKLEGTQIGQLYVKEYLGDSLYMCICSCKREHVSSAYLLKTNQYPMCSECLKLNKSNIYRESMYNKYGDIASSKIKNPREDWQLALLNDERKLREFIKKFEDVNKRLPTSYELAQKLDISIHILLTYTRQYKINLYAGPVSNGELEIRELLKEHKVLYNNKTAIYPLELDLYIPEKKLAIEFNGTYWHSSLFKENEYHQQKTILCAKQGIRLIHVFEYEWEDKEKRDKLIKLIEKAVGKRSITTVYARNTYIKYVNKEDAEIFLNKNHLQGYANSAVNIGLYHNDKLIALMTFGKPRFNNNYEYELIRLAYDTNVNVIGGAEKMFNKFIKEYKPKSIISYCDISKFTGNVYIRLGFKTSINDVTKPNYIWVNPITQDKLTRYQTMKQKLINMGLGRIEQTEDEIMMEHGYYKVYDSGNLRFTWQSQH